MKAIKTIDTPTDIRAAIKAGLAPASLNQKHYPRPSLWDRLNLNVGNGANDNYGRAKQ